MAKKTKEAKTTTKKTAKPAAPVDPVKTRNLLRLLQILSLLLAISAFLLQLFAVLGHNWKRQSTLLHPLISSNNYQQTHPNVYEDSRLDQNYGLYSRGVKLYANNDQHLDTWASTRFPRPDEGDASLHHCLSHTSTLRGAFLTCSEQIVPLQHCHCRRYNYWNWVIFFEIAALVLLGLALLLTALQTTHLQGILKPAAAGLALLAFIFMLVGLILILAHLKRETRSLADAFPHIYRRLTDKLHIGSGDSQHNDRYYQTVLRRAVRQTHETYRAYPLSQGQYPYNETHYQEYSEQARAWIYRPYSTIRRETVPPSPVAQKSRAPYIASQRRNYSVVATTTVAYSQYGPLLGYDQVFDNTSARIGCSTILSILSMIPALLLPGLLILSWLTGKKLATAPKAVTTTTTVKTEYVPVPQEVTVETVPRARPVPTDYDPRRPIPEAAVTAQPVRPIGPYETSYNPRNDTTLVRDVVISSDAQPSGYGQQYVNQPRSTQEHSFPVNIESSQTSYRT